MTRANTLRVATCLTAAWLFHAGSAHATPATWVSEIGTAGISNDALLYTGGASDGLDITGATVTGFVGIGGTGFLDASNSRINGGVYYAAASVPGGQIVSNSTITWGVTANQAAVTTALSSLSAYSTSLAADSGTAQNITAGAGTQTITATAGTLDASGNYVFTVSTVSLSNGGVLTINGTGLASTKDVVFNIATSASFDGSIDLVGLSADQVLFNITGSSSALTINGAGASAATLSADFLDYSSAITVENATVDGRVIGGDSSTLTVADTSAATTINGPGVKVPEPSSMALLGAGMLGLGALRRRKARRTSV